MCPAVATDEPNRCSWAASVPVEELSKAIAAAVGVWQPPAAPPLARLKSLQTPAAVRPCPARVSCNVTVQQMPVRRPTMIEVQEVQTQQTQQQQQQHQHVVAPVSPCVQQPDKKQQQQKQLVLFDNMDDMAAGIHVLGDVQEWQQSLIPCGSPSQHSPTSSSSSIASGPQLWVRSSVQQPHSSQHAANSTGLDLDSSSILSTGSFGSSCCSQTCLDQLWVTSSSSSSPRSSLDESSSLEHHQLCDSGLECEAGSACDELGADLCNAIGSLSPASSVGSVSGSSSSSSRAKQVKHVSWGPVSVVEFQVAPDASWLSSMMTRSVSAWWGSSSSSMPCGQVAAAGLMVVAAAMAAGALLARHAASRS